jgi:hypothetical protein
MRDQKIVKLMKEIPFFKPFFSGGEEDGSELRQPYY